MRFGDPMDERSFAMSYRAAPGEGGEDSTEQGAKEDLAPGMAGPPDDEDVVTPLS